MTPCVIGIDGGGTKTACEIARLDGAPLGQATGGPSNYQTIGREATRGVLGQVISAAVRAAGRAHGLDVQALCLAMAGVDRPADRAAVTEIATALTHDGSLGVHWAPDVRIAIENDAVASLVGGAGRMLGVVVVAGTGSIAFGMNASGERRRAGGWGHLLGDEGSGYAIGLAGLRAVARAHDGRAPATALTDLVLAALHLASPTDLIGLAYGRWGVPDVAAIAPLVFRAEADGDAVAAEIVEAAAAELALAGSAVIRGLCLEQEAFDVLTSGGAWQGSTRLRAGFAAAVATAAPRARVTAPREPPVRGAVLLALKAAGAVAL